MGALFPCPQPYNTTLCFISVRQAEKKHDQRLPLQPHTGDCDRSCTCVPLAPGQRRIASEAIHRVARDRGDEVCLFQGSVKETHGDDVCVVCRVLRAVVP